MSSSRSNTQPYALPQGIEALQQQQPIDPQHPGPAKATRSAVSKPQVDNKFAWVRHLGRTHHSMPRYQFDSQARREKHKLKHQRGFMKSGRRQTQPWDDSFDIWGNAYNNVRNSWIEQGIWRKVWDKAWAKERDDDLPDASPRSITPEPTKSQPGSRWGHEDGGPPPDPEFESDPYRTIYVVGELGMSLEEYLDRLPKWYVQESLAGPNYPISSGSPRNSEGSRPYRQFLYQIVKEREWIKDEMEFHSRRRSYNVDLDSMAYETIKNNWIEDQIWNHDWNALPGRTWPHEDPLQEQDKVDYSRTVKDSDQKGAPNSARVGAQGSEFSFAATPGPQVQVRPPGSHGEASKGGGKPELARRQSDDFDEQLPNWLRRNPHRPVPSSHEASDPAGTDKESLAPKGIITKGKQLAKRETAGAASNPRRPSPRASDAVAEQQGGVPNSTQTRGTKRDRPRRDDQHDTPRSAKRQKKSGKHGRGKK